jgi:hypothetical protein
MTDNIKQIQQNRVFGKDWQFSGESKNFPQLLDIRYEKDYKLSLKSKKLNPRKPKGMDLKYDMKRQFSKGYKGD